MNCMLVDVIQNTLANCNYTQCSAECANFLFNISFNCPVVFHNAKYLELWNSLIHICFQNNFI